MVQNAKSILIVGGSGFIGRSLVSRWAEEGAAVESWSRSGGPALDGVTSRAVDLLSEEPLPPPPGGRWDAVVHLAGQSRPNLLDKHRQVRETVQILGRVLMYLAETSPGCRLIVNSSAHVYSPSEHPHDETGATEPEGAYGLSKLLCEDLARLYANKMKVIIVRPFNLIGPGLPEGLLIPDLLDQIDSGEPQLVMRGNDALRDFLDIRDGVDAYSALLEIDCESGSVFNLCSGRATRVSELIQGILDAQGISREVRFQKSEEDCLVGSYERLHAATGWQPVRDLMSTSQFIMSTAKA